MINGLSSSSIRVKSAVLTGGRAFPVYPPLRTSRRDTLTEAMGQLRKLQLFVVTNSYVIPVARLFSILLRIARCLRRVD